VTTWAEDRALRGRNLSADPGVVSEARAVVLLPPTSLAYNTNAKNPSTTKHFNIRAILTRQSTFPFHAEPRQIQDFEVRDEDALIQYIVRTAHGWSAEIRVQTCVTIDGVVYGGERAIRVPIRRV